MKIEKVQWERTEEGHTCNYCTKRASWVLHYDVLEYSFWRYTCSDHRDTGQFTQFAGRECVIIEAV